MRPFSAIFVPDELSASLSDRAWLEAMLEAERSLVTAEARAGLVPDESARAVVDALDPGRYDVEALAAEGRKPGNPVEPLVRAIRAQVGDAHAQYVHRGATSQDILDTAAVLVATRALRIVDAELANAAESCARLAREHRGTVMAARTLLQQAVPTTFGYKAAGWLVALIDARRRLAAVELPAQLGGPAGTLSALGDQGAAVLALYSEELDLPEPVLPWHTRRAPFLRLAGALSETAVAVAKIAGDVVLLAQSEVGEVSEEEGGVSSSMPHKRNPAQAVLAEACARHALADASLLTTSGVHVHERAVGAWHAEWGALNGALAAAGGAAAAIARSLGGLRVNAARMRSNLAPELDSDVGSLGSVDAFIDRALAL